MFVSCEKGWVGASAASVEVVGSKETSEVSSYFPDKITFSKCSWQPFFPPLCFHLYIEIDD